MKFIQIKAIAALLLAFALVLSFAACGGGQSDTAQPAVPPSPPADTDPPVTLPAETEPAETEPAETEPAETEPAETEPAETEPAVTEPAETEAEETKPLCEHKFYENPKQVTATCLAEGYTEYTCKLCGEKEKRDIKPATEHCYERSVIKYASCTENGLEAMVCAYCGETDKDAYYDESVIYDGIISFDEPVISAGYEIDIMSENDFFGEIFLPEENETFWISLSVTPTELSDFTEAEGGATLLKFQIGGNVHRIMLRAFRVDEESVRLSCQNNDGKNSELSGVVLREGESYDFVIEYEIETKKYNIYLNDEMVGSNSMRLDYGAEKQYRLCLGGSGEWEFSNIEIFNSSHSFEPMYREYQVIEAYGHNMVTRTVDAHTLTHHRVEVSECENCGRVFDAVGARGAEHSFTLVERVADQETAAGIKIFGYEVFKCDCGYLLTVSANHADGHFYDVDIYTGKNKCRCGSVLVGELSEAYNGNADAGVIASGKGETNE